MPGEGGKGYGIKGDPARAKEMTKLILSKLFVREEHEIDGKKYPWFFKGPPEAFKARVIALLVDNFGLNKTEAGYTARILKNNIMKVLEQKDPDSPTLVTTTKTVLDSVKAAASGTPSETSPEGEEIEDGPENAASEDVYEKNPNVAFHFEDDADVFVKLPEEFTVMPGKDLYEDEAFKEEVRATVRTTLDNTKFESDSDRNEYISDLIQTYKEKEAYVKKGDSGDVTPEFADPEEARDIEGFEDPTKRDIGKELGHGYREPLRPKDYDADAGAWDQD